MTPSPGRKDDPEASALALLPGQAAVVICDSEGSPIWPEQDGIRLGATPLLAVQGGAELHLSKAWRLRGAFLVVGRCGGPWTGRAHEAFLVRQGDRHILLAGRVPLRWGSGVQGSLLLGRSAAPLWQAQWRTARPLALRIGGLSLGSWIGEAFLAFLDDRRRVIQNPLLHGHRLTWGPTDWFQVAGSRTILFGGEDRTQRLTIGDIWDMLIGRNENIVGYRGPGNSDQRASMQFRLRVPWVRGLLGGLEGLEGFYEYGGEDFLNPPIPSAVAHHYGGGLGWRGWTGRVEFVETVTGRNRWYDRHTVYGRSHYYRGNPLGLPLGADATSFWTGIWTPIARGPAGSLQARVSRAEQRFGVYAGTREKRIAWEAAVRVDLFLEGGDAEGEGEPRVGDSLSPTEHSSRAWTIEFEIARTRRIGEAVEPTAPPLVNHQAVVRVTVH